MLASGGVLNLVAALVLAFSARSGAQPSVAGLRKYPQSARQSQHSLPELPHDARLEADPRDSGVRSQPDAVSLARHAPVGDLHQCHVKPVFTNVGQRCQDCHADIHKRQLGANCEQCHTVRGWTVSIQQVQQHNNRFPLTGAHAAVDCDSCHKGAANSKFQTMSTDCYSCHAADFKSTTNPNHVTAQFGTTCNQCHGTDNWLNAKFDHSSVGFPLTNAHAVPPRQCTDCHINNNYNLNSTACVSCHLKDFQGTTNPNHVTANFPQTCEQCHNTISWLNASFNHNTTGFTLTGMHTVPPRQCTDCHAQNNYNLTSTACVTCHLKDYQGTTNPNHVTANFPQTCDQCHNTTSWLNATFNHNSTGFRADRIAHGSAAAVHRLPRQQQLQPDQHRLRQLPPERLQQRDHSGEPHHGGFPTTCETCHDTVQWTDGTFNHTTTGFALTGMHTVPPRQCTDCHVNNNYNLNSTACVTCHLKDYTGHHESGARRGRLPAAVRAVPRHHGVDGFHLQPQQHGVSADGIAHGSAAAVHRLPRQQQLHDAADDLHRLPPDGLQQHHESRPRGAAAVLPDDLPELPQHDELAERDFQSRAIHSVPDQSRRSQRRVLHLPHEFERLLGVPVHGLPWRQQREQFPSR